MGLLDLRSNCINKMADGNPATGPQDVTLYIYTF
jgi:hypothetical protein